MQKGSKEFKEVQEQFEKDLPNIPAYVGGKLDRVDTDITDIKGVYYNNGEVNKAFIFYLSGYSFAKSNYINQ